MEQNPLTSLYRVVQNRRANPAEGSYTCYLFSQGLDKILKKCGEECAETIIAAKNGKNEETVTEIADLIFHVMVMMAEQGTSRITIVKVRFVRSVFMRRLFHSDSSLLAMRFRPW